MDNTYTFVDNFSNKDVLTIRPIGWHCVVRATSLFETPTSFAELEKRLSDKCWFPLKFTVPNFQHVKDNITNFSESQKFIMLCAPEYTSLHGSTRFIFFAN